MTLPLLGLALERRPPESLLPLLVAMYRWCVPATLDPAAGVPVAVFATAASASQVPRGLPMALWTRSSEEAASDVGDRAAAIVSDDLEIVEAAGSRGVLATPGTHARGRRPMSPFVRQRLRRARGLPEVAVLEQTDGGWRWCGLEGPLEKGLVVTAMASAAAVATSEPETLLGSLAWAAPSVAEPGCARQVGAVAGVHVLVGETVRGRLELCKRLSSSHELSSRLSWAGRRLVERRHDADWAAMRLAELLALGPSPRESALGYVGLQLGQLGTPTDAKIASRLAQATAGVAEPK